MAYSVEIRDKIGTGLDLSFKITVNSKRHSKVPHLIASESRVFIHEWWEISYAAQVIRFSRSDDLIAGA